MFAVLSFSAHGSPLVPSLLSPVCQEYVQFWTFLLPKDSCHWVWSHQPPPPPAQIYVFSVKKVKQGASAHAPVESWLARLAFTCFCSRAYQLFRPHFWLLGQGVVVLTTWSFEQKVRPHQGFRVAFIRHFLVPLDKHLHSEPTLITLPLAAGPEESHRRNIHTIFFPLVPPTTTHLGETSTHTPTHKHTHTKSP